MRARKSGLPICRSGVKSRSVAAHPSRRPFGPPQDEADRAHCREFALAGRAWLWANSPQRNPHGVRMRDYGYKTFAVVPALALAGALIFGSAASAQNLVRVGAPLPLTGPLSPEGVKQKRGYDLWAETANAKGIKAGGKTYKVEIVYADYASNTPRAVQTAERMITEDKVQFPVRAVRLGRDQGGERDLGEVRDSDIARRRHPRRKSSTRTSNISSRRSPATRPLPCRSPSSSPPRSKASSASRPRPQRSVPARGRAGVREGGEEAHAEVVMFENATPSAPWIIRRRSPRCAPPIPDWVFASGYINDLILIRKQMNDLGLKAPVITEIAGPAYEEFARPSARWPRTSPACRGGIRRCATRAGRVRLDRGLQRLERQEQGSEADYIEARRPPPAPSCSWRSRRPAPSTRSRCATRSQRPTP